jgi:DNA (cytosine-5)-methyltransferase 1
MRVFSAVDAFCGAGGLSLGLVQAGFQVALGFDCDPICIQTLAANERYLNHRFQQTDIQSMLNGKLLAETGLKPGELDLLAGGPPCQGFSVQRTIGDDKDSRNLLVNDYSNLIIEVAPRFFLMENVPGLRGKRGRSLLERFETRMNEAGYFIHKKILDASNFGLPQRRRRLFIIGEYLEGEITPRYEWPEPTTKKPLTVQEVIGHLPAPPNDGSDHPDFPGHRADRLSEKNRARLRALGPGQGRTHLPDELLADCHKISAEITGHRNVYGRMNWDQVAPTITARFDSFTRGQFGHPDQIRSISLYEGSLLQTFPSNYRFSGTKVEIARQIGNAIPPKMAEIIATSIMKALNSSKSDTEKVA